MEKRKILILEDEFSIAMDIEMRLQKMDYEVIGIAHSYNDALPFLLEEEPDICLLDINLNSEKSGIDLGKLILEKFNVPIIFITAYTDEKTFSEAAKANPMGFITKPFKDADLRNNIELAIKKFEVRRAENPEIKTEDNSIFVKDKGVFKKIELSEIKWLEAMDNYTVIHCEKGQFIVHAFLKDVLVKLGSKFMRIHRSHGVALDKITQVEDNLVYLGEEFVTVSQNYRSELMERMKII
ncbi:MAG: response regulator [Bacteroidales bacterium]|nr:response regulator [Bacteroidales bacterium]